MKLMTYARLAIVGVGCLYLQSCALDEYFESRVEQYTKAFIKEFGLVDPEQDWTMGKNENAEINVGPVAKSVKIYGKYGDTYYKVADLSGIGGQLSVPVHVPKTCTDMMVNVDGRKFYGSFGKRLDCTDMSRGIPESTYDADGTNPNPAVYTNTVNGYTVSVKHTTKGNAEGSIYDIYNDKGAYQYFNTQQMSPLISTTAWDTYYSANTKKWTENPGNPKWIGLLPESGEYNRLKGDLETWISKKKAEGQSLVEDFRIATGDDGSFTLFPYYYGTNLKHELGVYLLDDNGNPLLKSGTYDKNLASTYTLDDFISFPVFVDRDPGDLQVQPHYDDKITGIRVMKDGNEITGDNPLVLPLGEEVDLQSLVQIKREGSDWMSYSQYITEYGHLYHGRVAYHFWVDEVWDEKEPAPITYAKCTNAGIVTGLHLTKDAPDKVYGEVGIAIGLGGPLKDHKLKDTKGVGRIVGQEKSFSYQVVPARAVKGIDIEESEVTMCPGDTKTLNVTLKDKDGNNLALADYFGEISVTGDWNTEICQIYKDESTKTIKLEAVGAGECWPRVYLTTSGYDGIYDYVHVQTSAHYTTKEYTAASDAISLTEWQEYFETSSEYKTDVTKGIFHEAGERTYTQEAEGWGTRKLDKDVFKDADNTYKLKIKLDKSHPLVIRAGWWDAISYDYYVGDTKYSSDSDCKTIAATEFEILLNDNMLEKLKVQGIAIQNASDEGVKYLKVEMVRPATGSETVWDWKPSGKNDMAAALATYYTGKAAAETGKDACDKCGVKFSSVRVTIMEDAAYNKIHYKVTWEQPSPASSVSKHRSPARSRSVSSREYDPTASHLNPGQASEWRDVNTFWSRWLPRQEEVASYPPNVCMLARARGYDVIITYGTDANGKPKPWVGNLGMYLKVLGSYDLEQNHNGDWTQVWYEENYTEYKKGSTDKNKEQYVVFSQKRFNKAADGTQSEQISALSVKHPMSGRTFLTFEDMRVTDATVTPAQFWKKSSDRDVNDLIFNIANYGSISNDKETITESKENEEGFSWIWALEDLGSTGDFDFNDVVMRISDITVTKTTTTTTDGVEDKDKGTTEIVRELRFKPLAAGGTLPIHIHLRYGGEDYTLAPGRYDLTKGEAPTGKEWHGWFGNIPSSTMINTGAGPDVKTSDTNACVLILKKEATIGDLLSTDNKFQDGSEQNILYVVVQGDGSETWNKMEAIDNERLNTENGAYLVPLPDKGKAAQSFFIVDKSGNSNWRWMREYQHICLGYPDFAIWVGDAKTDWTTKKNTDALYQR